MTGPVLHNLQITVGFGSLGRTLNGTNRHGTCDQIQFSSDEHGYLGWSCRVDTGEVTANTGVYKFGARLTAKIDPDSSAAAAGTVVWQGRLREPLRHPDGTTTLEADGWQVMLQYRDDPLLWMTRDITQFAAGDDEPFDPYFNDTDSIDVKIGKAGITFTVPKGQDINNGDAARAWWWYAADEAAVTQALLVRRFAGKIVTNRDNGGRYQLFAMRNTGPSAGSLGEAQITSGDISPGAKGTSNFNLTLSGQPMVGFRFKRVAGDTTSTDYAYKMRITNIRIGDRASTDIYKATAVVRDVAQLAGFTTTKVAADGAGHDGMPYWHTSGSWVNILDDMAHKEGGWRWAVWDGPDVEFAAWGTYATTWHVNGFTSAATSVVQVVPANDIYSHVAVYYHLHHSPTIRRVVKPTTQGALNSLTPPEIRVHRFMLHDGQKDSDHATDVATRMAGEYGADRYSGSIELSYATTGGTDMQALLVKPGDTVVVDDYPGGAVTWRVYEVDFDEDSGKVSLGIGRRSRKLHRRPPHHRHHHGWDRGRI